MVRKKILLIIVVLVVGLKSKSQTIGRSWFSEDNNICLSIDSNTKCVTINEFYDIEECNRITYKIKKNKLKLIWKANQRFFLFGWRKDIYWFNINKLTNDTLVLTLLPYKSNYFVDDNFWKVGNEINFIYKPNGCYNLIKWREGVIMED